VPDMSCILARKARHRLVFLCVPSCLLSCLPPGHLPKPLDVDSELARELGVVKGRPRSRQHEPRTRSSLRSPSPSSSKTPVPVKCPKYLALTTATFHSGLITHLDVVALHMRLKKRRTSRLSCSAHCRIANIFGARGAGEVSPRAGLINAFEDMIWGMLCSSQVS
jgi:hypothetical protein